ncbi:hypothetical protein HOU02_gp290 [Caulobacter phage CcrBL9]|uniref:Uncharacterized protein n=1 Tax=Caulobacter phage CcrBL9 TaxID=2283270 RepID=A0A385EEI4_9CAUD|nr:hypothetical protein HOU02_gp290 [Caulobacter phage CcrBL9]AXQ69435.1 hypothetical protein CcrBL9_gp411 [Caulobacter phage CcrBL9]
MTENIEQAIVPSPPKDRDLAGLIKVLAGALYYEADDPAPSGDYFNYHGGHVSSAERKDYRVSVEGNVLSVGANLGDDFYNVNFLAPKLYDRLEAFFAQEHGRRIHALLEQVTDHERRYVEHLFGPDAAK